jgi:hypothetical protein
MDNLNLDVTIKLQKHVCCHEHVLKFVHEKNIGNNIYIQDFD